ncbi:GGDEF domain-containing protein [Saccharospirillum mangrovi]|uniref:GGDEF domain-containing protein n=1 Tax=Saccharospirillum mangrovi TaxID=2161747 RepID=UPI001300244D|nr:GGDEF domain-containing protein [Saccharospirillum mangrovi]
MMKQLQATLDIEQILRTFFNEVQHLVPLDGCHYQAEHVGLMLDFGDTGRHRCNYELSLHDEQFGRLGFSRNRRLQEREMQLLESVMDVLIYPLRNALLYRKALATAMIDPLTGLNNRGAMAITLNREMDRMRRHNQDMSILMVDIDRFKDINDRYGHLAGDDVLRQVAQIIDTTIRGCDACFRFGGEEFLIMLTDSNLPLARMVAERLRHTVCEQTRSPAPNAHVTISVGVAHFDNESDWPELVDRADRALYQAKQDGRNRVAISQPVTAPV